VRFHVHGAVQANNGEASICQKGPKHLLGRDELREDQHFEIGIPLFLLEPVEPIQKRLGLGVGAFVFTAPGGF